MKKLIIALLLGLISICGYGMTTEEFIALNEGFSPVAYTCAAGKKTIGYGFTDKAYVDAISMTEWQAKVVLAYKVAQIKQKLVPLIKVELTQNQRTVLVDFVYQYGLKALKDSTLLSKINSGAPVSEINFQIRRWNKIKNPTSRKYEISKGLDNRNDRRVELWSK